MSKRVVFALTSIVVSVIVIVFAVFFFLSPAGRTMFGTKATAGGFRGIGMANVNSIPTTQTFMAFSKRAPLATDNESTSSSSNRLVIKNAYLQLEVKNTLETIGKIRSLTETSGGFVVNSNVQNQLKKGSITIRIPAQKLNQILKQIRTLSTKVISENIQGRDITSQYTDLKSRLNNLKAAETQLQKIMAKAKKTADVMLVYNRIVSIRGQIDVLEGRMKYYQQSVTYSKISINLHEKIIPVKKDVEIQSWYLGATIKTAAKNLANATIIITRFFLRAIILYLPILLMIIIPILLFIWLVTFVINLFRRKRS